MSNITKREILERVIKSNLHRLSEEKLEKVLLLVADEIDESIYREVMEDVMGEMKASIKKD